MNTSKPYLKSVLLLRELHRLTLAGQEESPEADAVRDLMDDPWHQMTDVEQDLLRMRSALLREVSDRAKE